MDRNEVRDIAIDIIAKRDIRYVSEKKVSFQAIDNLCKRHGLLQARPERLYERKATPSRVTVEKL